MSYVVKKTKADGTVAAVEGCGSTIIMKTDAVAAKPEVNTATKTMASLASDILKFTRPVPFGQPVIRGKSLKELADDTPMFSPIEGLPEDLWKKPCATFHQLNAKRLCDRGAFYIPRAAAFRHQHPNGGPYKLALMQCAKTDCQ